MFIVSLPRALLGSKPLLIFPMSLSVKEMLNRDLSVKLVGSSLGFVINEQWLAMKELKSSALSLKSVMNLLSLKKKEIQGTFLPSKKLFKIEQYVFELVLGSVNFLSTFEKYYCFEVSIKLLKFFWRGSNFFYATNSNY